MDEILKVTKKITFNNAIYIFKGPTSSINFGRFGGPVYLYSNIKNSDTTLQQLEKQQKVLKKELNEITSGNPKHIIKMLKTFVTQDKKLSIY